MSKLTAEQQAKGRKRFLEQNPQYVSRIAALTQQEADFMCTTLESLREAETMKALAEYARARGIDSHELFLSCIADTAEEFTQLYEPYQRALQRAIGL